MTQSLLPETESSPIEKGDAEAASSGADTTSARSAGSALRRPGRGWRIALLSVLAIFLVLTLATGGLALWVRHSIASGMEFIADPFAGIPTRAPQQKVAAGEEPAVNILVLGTDSRTSASDPSQWKEGAQRTDAIMIVQVSGDRKTVSVMSIPRDSWVEIPGHGQGKINAAYSYGGPSLTIHTVENLTGIHIDHFAVANFESFVALTDEIGGVRVNLKTPQTLAGKELGAGAQVLNGQQALAYTRERSSLPNGDFDRVKRQQTWMRSIVSRVLTNGTLSSPTALYSFLKTASRTVAVDESFTLNQMQSLALETRHLHSNDIAFMTVPTAGTGTSADGQSIVTLDADADAPLFKAFAEDRVSAYLTEHPDAVELLPATVN
ncbi:Transcriptional regulator LytR [Actinomyces naeslundii]|uniref:LCP family protein n=1 Tax=Actinomyces naeslundii TaxID=1655 RepID=UPI00195C3E52|nr:LCP family protein [Actinomyces naeslundii]VTX57824.1 Transcriptional regulator LytR [Actinomyces naeslundii]